jgi:hypothetical protein
LLVADQFVHGIGGARYDQITDAIIARHFGIDPPRFSVTTATLYSPAAAGRQRVCLPCLQHEGHRLQHSVLGPRKHELVAQIRSAPRRSTRRQELFMEMHRARRAAAATSPALKTWEQRYRDAEVREQEDQLIFDRELFYAIQSRARLEMMIDRYGEEFATT